jgi:hypothetical protein
MRRKSERKLSVTVACVGNVADDSAGGQNFNVFTWVNDTDELTYVDTFLPCFLHDLGSNSHHIDLFN